jgi:hypothetical protein
MCLAACSKPASLLIDSQSLIDDGALFEYGNGRGSTFVPTLSRLLASVVAGNPRNYFVFLNLLWFYQQSFSR